MKEKQNGGRIKVVFYELFVGPSYSISFWARNSDPCFCHVTSKVGTHQKPKTHLL